MIKQVNPSCSLCGQDKMFFEKLIWLNTREASEYLRISIGSLKNLAYRGVVTPRKLGRLNRYKKLELDRLLEDSLIGGIYATV